jgi:hypothetical protein
MIKVNPPSDQIRGKGRRSMRVMAAETWRGIRDKQENPGAQTAAGTMQMTPKNIEVPKRSKHDGRGTGQTSAMAVMAVGWGSKKGSIGHDGRWRSKSARARSVDVTRAKGSSSPRKHDEGMSGRRSS